MAENTETFLAKVRKKEKLSSYVRTYSVSQSPSHFDCFFVCAAIFSRLVSLMQLFFGEIEDELSGFVRGSRLFRLPCRQTSYAGPFLSLLLPQVPAGSSY